VPAGEPSMIEVFRSDVPPVILPNGQASNQTQTFQTPGSSRTSDRAVLPEPSELRDAPKRRADLPESSKRSDAPERRADLPQSSKRSQALRPAP